MIGASSSAATATVTKYPTTPAWMVPPNPKPMSPPTSATRPPRKPKI
jgi:hypothetical protein